ncbi:MAG: DndE family protein [Candidatus Thiosymbion ectosymbiont of Robbea hypermnestra]|nr:DndE family protein [Candidatus Thiosymbion ectosymbiont of Robbea hypermnestra]
MARVYTSRVDEDTVDSVLRKGLMVQGPKWTVLRIALALSLKQSDPPSEAFDTQVEGKGGEYSLDQITGRGQKEPEEFVDAFRALLSAYHGEDLFGDDDRYTSFLQRHIRRGLREIRSSWRESHDFHEFLRQEFFTFPDDHEEGAAPDTSSLIHALEEFGLTAVLVESRDGPRVTRHTVRFSDAEDYSRLERRLNDLGFTLGLKDAGIFLSPAGEPKTAWLDVPRPAQEWKSVGVEAFADWSPQGKGLPLMLGVDIRGDPIIRNLAEAPHVLLAGTTGSGKSVCLHAILLSLLANHDARGLRLLLVDPKRVELSPYEGLPHLLAPIVTDGVEAARAFKNLTKEMEQREKLLASRGVREWDSLQHTAPPRIVVIVEELADLFDQGPESEDPLVRLAQKARATGIHLVLATQRPDAATFSGLLRANVPSRIALTVLKAADSRIILDEDGAERLLGKGDMLVKWLGEKLVRVHGFNVRPTDVTDAVKHLGREG